MSYFFCAVFKIFIIVLALTKKTCEEKLWCYECNTDLSMGHKGDCNDPYLPSPSIDLVACPEDESQQCLKARVSYKNVHTTVRGCVSSRSKNAYCTVDDKFPEAYVTCTFCEDYACNLSPRLDARLSTTILIIFLLLLLIVSSNLCHGL